MKKIISRLKLVFQFIVTSIGFYPTLIAALFFGFAVLIIYFETQGISTQLKDKLPFFIITHGETATMILSSIATGIFSLIVFSFTMVMLVLNQASANFSPRVIPGLISSKSNQKVLGLYLGTLIYTLVVMVNIRSEFYDTDLPGLAVFLAMCFTFLCLAFFVYFIHSIALTIQIGNILESIYEITVRELRKEIKEDESLEITHSPSTEDWQELTGNTTGYMQKIDRQALVKLCQKQDVVLEFMQPLGDFVIKGTAFARISKRLEDLDAFCEEVHNNISFYQEELVNLNYLHGFKHITESAVKALSPSVNDPGTAIKAIDYLTDLFILRMRLPDVEVYHDTEDVMRLRLFQVKFAALLSLCLGSLRLYGKNDTIIILRLLYLIKVLFHAATADHPEHIQAICHEARLILHDAQESIQNPGDRNKINVFVKDLNTMDVTGMKLPMLSKEVGDFA